MPVSNNFSAPKSPEIRVQQDIGYYHMIVRFMAMKWKMVLDKLGVQHPQSRSEILLTLLWGEICEPIWKASCNSKHNAKKISTLDKSSSLPDKLRWYHQQQDEVLDCWHRFLVDYDPGDVEHWTRITRTSKITLLDNAIQSYKVECKQSTCQQSTIYDWMDTCKNICSGRLIGEGLTDA